jgi:hypothetical protein
MARDSQARSKGVSLAKGPVALIGAIMLAYGITGLIFGGHAFSGVRFPSGTANGATWLGLEGNGWTNLLWIAAGGLLMFGSPLHWGAKSMALIVGLVLGAASVIALVDGDDVLGIFAANGPTKLALGVASVVLLVLALLPRVGGSKKRDADRERDRGAVSGRERPTVARERDRGSVTSETRSAGRAHEPVGDGEGYTTRERRLEGESQRGAGAVESEPIGSGRTRRVVAPADGDGPRDHGRNRDDAR